MKIKVKVKPNSKQQTIEKLEDDFYLVKLTSLPIKGKANAELIKLLKKHFKKHPKIVSGFRSRIKVVELE